MKVGFTGTRQGMTRDQEKVVTELLIKLRVTEGHHGDCVGSDEEFHDILESLALDIVVHPPSNPKLRAWCKGPDTMVLRPQDYLRRNRDIVRATEALIGTPKEEVIPAPARGQGTWSTIRHGFESGKTIYIVFPSGKVQTNP